MSEQNKIQLLKINPFARLGMKNKRSGTSLLSM